MTEGADRLRLQALEISGFRAFAKSQELPLKPLTLLYGPNSGGKSSLLRMLLILSAGITTGTLPGRRFDLGGEAVDLGDPGLFPNRMVPMPHFGLKIGRSRGPVELEVSGALSCDTPLGLVWASVAESGLGRLDFSSEGAAPEGELALNWQDSDLDWLTQTSKLGSGDADLRVFQALKDHERSALRAFLDWQWHHQDAPFWPTVSDSRVPFTLGEEAGTSRPAQGIPDLELEGYRRLMDHLRRRLSGSASKLRRAIPQIAYCGPVRPILTGPDLASGQKTWDSLGLREADDVQDLLARTGRLLREMGVVDELELQEGTYCGIDREVLADALLSYQEKGWEDASFALLGLEKQDSRYLYFNDPARSTRVQLSELGSGVSQILPIALRNLRTRNGLVLVEQPELHLHPRLQAETAELFLESALSNGNTVVVETHSEHLALRILRRMRESTRGRHSMTYGRVTPDEIGFYFVLPPRNLRDGTPVGSQILELPTDEYGRFLKPWPGGFFEESFNEIFPTDDSA